MQKLFASVLALTVLTALSLPALVEAFSFEVPTTIVHVREPGQEPEEDSSCDVSDIYISQFLVKDLRGSAVTRVTAGSQLVIEATIDNRCSDRDKQQQYILFEVRDYVSATLYESWQNSTIGSNQRMAIGTSWVVPDIAGEYQIIVFYVGCLCPLTKGYNDVQYIEVA